MNIFAPVAARRALTKLTRPRTNLVVKFTSKNLDVLLKVLKAESFTLPRQFPCYSLPPGKFNNRRINAPAHMLG